MYCSIVSRSRMPPPSCTGTESPTASRIARIAAWFLGLPAAAPFRSTMCSRRAPSPCQCFAMPPGSSENTVASLMFPCFRRTQWPSLISIAGMISIGATLKALRTSGAAGPQTGKSGIPVDEVGEEPQAGGLAFFGMELYRENIIPCHCAGKGQPVARHALHHLGLLRLGEVAVDEVEAGVVLDARPERVRPFLPHLVPSHVRNLEARAV